MAQAVRWGILGPGKIANRFADQLRLSRTGVLHAVAGRDAARAQSFADRWQVQRVHRTFDALLADPEIDAVYIATPHRLHANWAIAAMAAGKHVLCEKPLAVSHPEATAVAEVARRNDAVLLEAYMHLFHPQIDTLLQILRDGRIGDLQHIDASFSFVGKDRRSALFDESRAGGAILDVGGYPVSITRLIVSAALGHPADPVALTAKGSLLENVDIWSSASLTFEDGITASLRAGITLLDAEEVVVYGSAGYLRLHTPWVVEPEQRPVITLSRAGEPIEEIACVAGSSYAAEADAVGDAIIGDRQISRLTLADSLANLSVMDRWREAIGLQYSFEREDAHA